MKILVIIDSDTNESSILGQTLNQIDNDVSWNELVKMILYKIPMKYIDWSKDI